jgi:hypothetical protein
MGSSLLAQLGVRDSLLAQRGRTAANPRSRGAAPCHATPRSPPALLLQQLNPPHTLITLMQWCGHCLTGWFVESCDLRFVCDPTLLH